MRDDQLLGERPSLIAALLKFLNYSCPANFLDILL